VRWPATWRSHLFITGGTEARHEIPLLWRWLHQIRHVAARLEAVPTFYKHPLEMLLNGILTWLILYALVGVTPAAAAIAVSAAGIAELFYHWNVRTLYWLGFFIQLPEAHRVHHQRDHHRDNYSDLPLWDMLFGTFPNPRIAPDRCGFSAPREAMIEDMLLGKNVNVERA